MRAGQNIGMPIFFAKTWAKIFGQHLVWCQNVLANILATD